MVGSIVATPGRDVLAAVGELCSCVCRNADDKVDSIDSIHHGHVLSRDCHVS